MRTRPIPRGLTLIELVVAMTVSAIVLAGIVGVVGTQQRAYSDGQRQRTTQAAGRSALLFLEQALQLAGYGLDAPLAFDFDRYAGPCPVEMSGCPRDSVENSDEIVVYHRNPRYWVPDDYGTDPVGNAWRIVGAGGALTVSARPGDVFPKGQIVQAVCRAGTLYAYATVSTTTVAAGGNLPLPLEPTDAADPFRRQDATADGCFGDGQARLFLVERHRFHVRPVRAGAGYVPYLMRDAGVDSNRDGAVDEADEVVLAEGIESVQFAYVMTNNALAPRGVTPGTPVTLVAAAVAGQSADGLTLLSFPGVVDPALSIYRPTSFYGFTFGPPAHAQRLTDHQANIRAVAISLVARSTEPERILVGATPLGTVLNQDRLPAWVDPAQRALPAVVDVNPAVGHYLRVRFDTTVPVRNMMARAMTDF